MLGGLPIEVDSCTTMGVVGGGEVEIVQKPNGYKYKSHDFR